MFIQGRPLVYACPLLMTLISMQVAACQMGSFGENCQFKCHCKKGQCDLQGICTPEKCHEGYFGPQCQYIDLMFSQATLSNWMYLQDNNEETCNPNKDERAVEIMLTSHIVLYWMRVYVNEPVLFTRGVPKFKLTLDQAGECSNMRVFLGFDYMDITCGAIMINSIILQGNLVGHMCSVYFSGGRNVAINETAVQSSTWLNNERHAGAQNAVDGSTNSDFLNSESCSRTDSEQSGPTWSVSFTFPQIVYSVVIFIEQEEKYEILGFKLVAFNSAGSVVHTYRDTRHDTSFAFTVSPFPQEPISSITIQQMANTTYRILTLCEVQVFAETICPAGTFGLMCEKNCTCKADSVCHVTTGLCSTSAKDTIAGEEIHELIECPNGTYGLNCSLLCPAFCLTPNCDQQTGACEQCAENRRGSTCAECVQNTFGPACSSSCPPNCLHSCDAKTGNCDICKPGFTGLTCEHATSSRILPLIFATILACVIVFLVVTYIIRRQRTEDDDSESDSSVKTSDVSERTK